MDAFEASQLLQEQRQSGKPYLEFLHVSALSAGIYHLPARGTDPQAPHSEDEVYYVISGRAQIRVGHEDRPVQAGSIIYVPEQVVHRFHSIEQDLAVLVFFAPAEYTNQ